MSLHAISVYFQQTGYMWKFKDGLRVPTLEEITESVERAIKSLEDKPDMTQIEFGRLIVQRNDTYYDVYVHIAALPL